MRVYNCFNIDKHPYFTNFHVNTYKHTKEICHHKLSSRLRLKMVLFLQTCKHQQVPKNTQKYAKHVTFWLQNCISYRSTKPVQNLTTNAARPSILISEFYINFTNVKLKNASTTQYHYQVLQIRSHRSNFRID